MILERSTLLIGEGRLSGAREIDGQLRFFIDSNGFIASRDMPLSGRGLTREQFASYADEHTQTLTHAVSIYGDQLKVQSALG